MKRLLALCLALAMLFCGCKKTVELPEEEIPAEVPVTEIPAEETSSPELPTEETAIEKDPITLSEENTEIPYETVEEMLLLFGAQKQKNGRLLPDEVTLLYHDGFAVEDMTPEMFYYWYHHYSFMVETSQEDLEAKYRHPDFEGWFYPQEVYEANIQKYFDVSTELLRSDSEYYDKEHEGYHYAFWLGRGASPSITIKSWECSEDILSIFLQFRYSDEMRNSDIYADRYMTLTVKLEDEGYKFLSYLPA